MSFRRNSIQCTSHFYQVLFIQSTLQERSIITCCNPRTSPCSGLVSSIWFFLFCVFPSCAFLSFTLVCVLCIPCCIPWQLFIEGLIHPKTTSLAVCQCSSGCLSPRNSITFLLAGCSSAFTTVIAEFHNSAIAEFDPPKYEIPIQSPNRGKNSNLVKVNLWAQHNTKILLSSKTKLGFLFVPTERIFLV